MCNIAIVTDSSSSLPVALVQKFNIYQIPINIMHRESTYKDGEEINSDTLYNLIEQGEILKTSQPSPGQFLALYKRLSEKFRTIISIHVTGKGSGTVQVARLVARSLPEADIEVIDSQTTSIHLGFMALAAAKAAKIGKSKEEIMKIIREVREKVVVYLAIPSLEFLRRSGRLNNAAAFLGSMVNLKLVVTVKDGLIVLAKKIRTFSRALDWIVAKVSQEVEGSPVKLAVLYSRDIGSARAFHQKVACALGTRAKALFAEMGASLGIHGGPGMLGIAALQDYQKYFEEDDLSV